MSRTGNTDGCPEPRPEPSDAYPKVPYDIDEDIRGGVLRSCEKHIQDGFYTGRMHGLDVVIEKETAYYNASHIVRNDDDLQALMESDAMKASFEYIRDTLGREPFYLQVGRENRLLNGVYMHGMTLGNVVGNAVWSARRGTYTVGGPPQKTESTARQNVL